MAVDIAKIRAMTPDEMAKEELELRQEIWKLRLQVSTGQAENPYKVRMVRRDLARLLTVRRENELAAEQGDK
jgi:large subunit ribosomal protein L29